MKKAIIGAGGFGTEIFWTLSLKDQVECMFFVDDPYFNNQEKTLPLSKFDPTEYQVIVAIADPIVREE